MKSKVIICLANLSLILLTSCTQVQAKKLPESIKALPVVYEEKMKYKKITDYEMMNLFETFLNIDEDLILILNQKPKTINSNYWEAYLNYKVGTKRILKDFLSDKAKDKLEKQHIQDDFNFFRLIKVDDHLLTKVDKLLAADIVSKEVQIDSVIYEVEVKALVDTIDYDLARDKYIWSDEKGYYIDTGSVVGDKKDKIKVLLSYYVEVPKSEEFCVSSIKEKERLHLAMEEGKQFGNNVFVQRLAFSDKLVTRDKEKIYKFLDIFMKQDYSYYEYYRIAYETSFESFKTNLESDLGLYKLVYLNRETYRGNFSPDIIPLKDNIAEVNFDPLKDITVLPHILSSDKKSAYKVILNTELVLLNKNKGSLVHTYLFILENGIISSIKMIT